jgi:nicotinamidase-related amidase
MTIDHASGFGGRAGFGERPALLIIDMNNAFTDPASPLVCDLDSVVAAIAQLLDGSRRARIPIVYTNVIMDAGSRQAAKAFIDKIPVLTFMAPGTRWIEIDDRIAPLPDEAVIVKNFASSFFGTALSSLLASAGCDSVIVTGASTSGCVRASVVDCLQHGYRPLIPREAVGDRNQAAHEANLYDMDAKYGDVVSLEETLDYLEALSAAHAR